MKIGLSDLKDDLVHLNRRVLNIGSVNIPWPFPIVYALGSSEARVFGCLVYGRNAPRYIRWLGRFFSKISDAKWKILYRFHPHHRYHMIDTGLGYGYHERNDMLLYSAMVCLVGYIEDCKGTGVHDPGDEARAIYHWWKVTRPTDQAQHAKWMDELYGDGKSRMRFVPSDEYPQLTQLVFDKDTPDNEAKRRVMWDLEKKIHNDEQEFLHRLINIRPGMWT
jgi:hypothetical protein